MPVIHSTRHSLCKQDAVRPMPRIYGAQAISFKTVSMTEAVSRHWPLDAHWARLRALRRAFGFPGEKLAYRVEVSVGKEITGACVGLSAGSERDDRT